MNIATMGGEDIIICSVLATGTLRHYEQQGFSALCRILELQCRLEISLKLFRAEKRRNISVNIWNVII